MSQDASRARLQFDEIVGHPHPDQCLRDFIANEHTEEEWLDFKGAIDKGNGKSLLDKKFKEIFSEAVSGFGNTEGGVLVFGIDARKNADDIDCAVDVSLVDTPAQIASYLRGLINQVADPPLQGIEICEIEDTAEKPKGFVLCFIPEGDLKPYRAEMCGSHKPYFIRVGDSFTVPNRSLLRSLFFPRSRSLLRPELAVTGSGENILFHLFVRNTGPASSNDVVVRIRWYFAAENVTYTQEIQPRITDFQYRGSFSDYLFHRPVHPGDRVFLVSFDRGSRTEPGLELEIDVLTADRERERFRCDLSRGWPSGEPRVLEPITDYTKPLWAQEW